ncbi:MAG: hypothetical protein M1834_000280 [Cirrosporium novae-zelandiae]|nr:MAG: hypothetical protein M1834_000280 [Cirrosporium novae-zelandiae]
MERSNSNSGASRQSVVAPSRPSRSRSNTANSINARPKSRASTTSIQSAGSKFALPPQRGQENVVYHQQFTHPPMPADAGNMNIQHMPTMQNMQGQYYVDPALQPVPPNQANRGMTFQPLRSYDQNLSVQYSALQGYSRVQAPGQDNFREETTAVVKKVKKGSASSIANDNELRRLHRENQGRSLKDVARQVLEYDRGPKSEKMKQIFAMLWLESVCKRQNNSSVPRNRVFSHYANRCGTERVSPLNPASFGKLVRIIFPGIHTRRLGVRGESKYHYVDLTLEEDQQDLIAAQKARATAWDQAFSTQQGQSGRSSVSGVSQLPADTSLFPSPSDSFHNNQHRPNPQSLPLVAVSYGVFSAPLSPGSVFNVSPTSVIKRPLKFSMAEELPFSNDPIELPNIHNFVPSGTDRDTAESLNALYRSHVVSVIDCLRFCKEKQLFQHYVSFHGTLTVPVQKLLSEETLAPWIKACDWLMYQNMIRCVGPLTLQVLPAPVLSILKAISEHLTPHIATTFRNLPPHVVTAKLEPATIFARLVTRLLRVNELSHNAANLLCHDANRNQMWKDWVMHVKPTLIVESSVPICGFSQVLDILTREIRVLLTPLEDTTFMTESGIYTGEPNSNPLPQINPLESHLDRWSTFLTSLPSRFPGLAEHPKLVINCINNVGSAVIRDITLGQGQSFGYWWVLKAWIDEMMQWLAEKGGFMDYSTGPCRPNPVSASLTMDITTDNAFGSRPQTAASHHTEGEVEIDFSLPSTAGDHKLQLSDLQNGNHDDSAISLGEDFKAEWGANIPSDPNAEDVVVR